MNIIKLPSAYTTPVEDKIDAFKFYESKAHDLNNHTLTKIRAELRLIKQGLLMHGYPIKKLSYRETWRIGKADDLYLLSYQLDPHQWVLFPYNQNLTQIVSWSLTKVTAIASTESLIRSN